ncbi:hypothetical protein NQZ68_040752 [Dissostichus eleginoides]|nr:hypothetical protein NQZ68_040752 [Dissostichus eleginoides]
MELASALERGTQSEAHCKGQRYLEAKGRTLAPESLSRSKEATTHGRARTQSPTTTNYAVEIPTFGEFAAVSIAGVQWPSLALVGGTNCSTAAGVFFGLNAKEATGESHEPCSRSSCAAGGKGVAWDVEDPSQGHREGLDWDNYVATSVERNTYEFNLFLHWELKEGLAPFTPRIDPVLQRLRARCAHLLPCGKTNTDASRNKKRWFQLRAETAGQKLQHISSGTFLDSMPKELKVPIGGTNCSTAAGVFFGLNAKEATVGGTNCSTAAGVFFGLNAKEVTGESHEPCSRSSCAAGGKGVAWDVEDPSQGHREGLDWDNYVAVKRAAPRPAVTAQRVRVLQQTLRVIASRPFG